MPFIVAKYEYLIENKCLFYFEINLSLFHKFKADDLRAKT
jgi:hypothetical protein